ncbi:hypothetical protein DFH11DRAFT_1687498 [Phellopilus nigrolimitatus]|nr:hypothetical protein DFH11DRAFT_1687498 [Phellopilus nigrolimitatus]
MAPAAYDLYFTGLRATPRQCIIIGEDVEPVFFRFETPEVFMTNTRTMVSKSSLLPRPSGSTLSAADQPRDIYRNQDETVAAFDWSANNYLGMCSVKHRQSFPMSRLVLPGSSASARAFFLNGSKFEWRRTREDPCSYDATPVGPSHAFLQYTFAQPALLLEALLALSVNRWIDANTM